MITGVTGLTSVRGAHIDGDTQSDACDWGLNGDGSVSIAFTTGTTREPATDEHSKQLTASLGHNADVNEFDPTVCWITVSYSDERKISLLLRPSTQTLAAHPATAEDSVCDRSATTIEDIFKRVPWK